MKNKIEKNKNNSSIAVVEKDTCLTYKGLYHTASNLSQKINSLLNRRSHIAILLPNSISYVIAYVSVILAEHVTVPIYYKATSSEIVSTINYCDVGMVITNKAGQAKIQDELINHRVYVYNIDSCETTMVGSTETEPFICSPSNTLLMLGTSGSTSTPKRVMLSYDNITSNVDQIIESLNYDESERFLSVLPLTFASGNTTQLCVSLALGATLYIYSDPFYPTFFCKAVKENKITTTTLVPTLVKTLLSDNTFFEHELPSLKTICYGGAPIDGVTNERMVQSLLRDSFVHIYGQTEASPRISHLHLSKEREKIPSVGKAFDNIEVCIKKEHSNDGAGEILIKGPNVMQGYYKSDYNPINEGWLETGDIGYIDDDGYIYITGRKKNIIIYSGMNIYAEEVEEVLCRHEQVKEAVVLAKPSEQYGEIPIAKVVLKPQAQTTELELRQFCARKLSQYKVPAKIIFVEELPRTQNGKILHTKETSHE